MAKEKERKLKMKDGNTGEEEEKEEKGRKSKKSGEKKGKWGVLILLVVTILVSLVFSIKAKGGIKGLFLKGKRESGEVQIEEEERKKSWWPFEKKVYEFEKNK